MNGHIHLKPAILSHEEKHYEKRIYSGQDSLLLLLTATIWGVAFVAQSVSMDYIGGFTFNAVRNLIGALTLLPVIWGLGKTKAPEEKKRIQASSDRKTLITRRIFCCGYPALLCKQLPAVWHQIHQRW